MKRKFKRQIFLGNEQHSKKQIKTLKKRLDKGLIILGGIQQHAFANNDNEQKDLEIITRDFAMALLGKEIDDFYT